MVLLVLTQQFLWADECLHQTHKFHLGPQKEVMGGRDFPLDAASPCDFS